MAFSNISKASMILPHDVTYQNKIFRSFEYKLFWTFTLHQNGNYRTYIQTQKLLIFVHISFLFIQIIASFLFSYPEFGASEEAGALEDLLRAYDDGDEEAGSLVLARPIFKYLDNMVSFDVLIALVQIIAKLMLLEELSRRITFLHYIILSCVIMPFQLTILQINFVWTCLNATMNTLLKEKCVSV